MMASGQISEIKVRLVCTPRIRAQVQSSHAKWGGGSWNRDIHHASLKTADPLYEGGAKTLCGRDCSDWLTVENNTPASNALGNADLCAPCTKKLTEQVPA